MEKWNEKISKGDRDLKKDKWDKARQQQPALTYQLTFSIKLK